MSEPLQIEDSLIYRLTDPDGVNCDEINVTMWQGSRNHRPRTAGARRVLACIDACAGATTDDLEKYGFLAMRTKQVAELERQRDDLLVLLQNLVESLDGTTWSSWQTTARFDPDLTSARDYLATIENKP